MSRSSGFGVLFGLLALAGCAHAPATPPETGAADPAAEAARAPAEPIGFAVDATHTEPWGLRVARHKTLPSPRGERESLHFDSEEDSRIWLTPGKDGRVVVHEVLARHHFGRNGEDEEEPVMTALLGVPIAMELSREGRFIDAVDAPSTLAALSKNWPGPDSAFERMPPQLFSRELERDWRLGAQVYLEQPVRPGDVVYTLQSISLPQLPGKYVAVAETFDRPVVRADGRREVSSAQLLFGRRDPRWPAARAKLAASMEAVGIDDDDVLLDFLGKGDSRIDPATLEVFRASTEGEGIYPLPTPRGAFPLRFQIEEVAGSITAPPLPPEGSGKRADPARSVQLMPRPAR